MSTGPGLTWEPDPLGPGWEHVTLGVSASDPGLVTTVVRRTPAPGTRPGGPAVLHVHGFNDYFFQTHLADALERAGHTFYAVDLRRCGRSWRPGQVPHYVDDLAEYRVDLGLAARLVRDALGHDRLAVHAHSTGGLTAALWADSPGGRAAVDALVLDSPWFDLDARWFHRVVSTWVLDTVGPVDRMRVLADGPSAYSWHLHVANGGRWDYDRRLKPAEGFPVRAGWLRAVRRGQARLARGLHIPVPVLVATAAESGPNSRENPLLDAQDTVLDVGQIRARAHHLGDDVTLLSVPGGIHDLTLSADVPRALYLDAVTTWLQRTAPPR
ncbi:alpha/beta hydrolase [Cellulomonas sp. NPDC058312]|uniref:alpha/beta hydrolase n=1 Tax=Cellulomonas sp. NPDC058312 TaxID=3346441 RepID=UPI0036E61362